MKVDLDKVRNISETRIHARGPSQRSSNRTTVPKAISDCLALKHGDSIRWFVMKDGSIMVDKVRS
jgi:hypothetical protein